MADLRGLGRRLPSAFALAAVALAAVYFGHPWFTLMVAGAAVLMAREWCELCLAGAGACPLWWPRPPVPAVILVVAVVVAVAAAAAGFHGGALLAALVGAAFIYVGAGRVAVPTRAILAAGVPYIVVPAVSLIYLARDPLHGVETVFWLFAVVWSTDIGGYVVGRLLGGAKLAPRLSPGKTWSGLVGATSSAALAGSLFAWVTGAGNTGGLAVAAIAVSLVAQGGDLMESAVKRHFAVKDSGSIIPGHGGLFDRVDGLVAGATLVAAAALMVGNTGFLWQ